MKKRNILLLALISIVFEATSAFGQQKLETFSYHGKSLSYTILLPKGFDVDKTYPVMVGPSSTESARDQSFYWRGTTDSQGWILVGYSATEIEDIKALFEHLKSKYNVESNKFYTTCHSANSAGIFDIVMEIPTYFAGIIGMAGNPNNSNPTKMRQLKGIKVRFVVGDNDHYWMRTAKKSHQILQDIGVDSAIEIVKNGGHVLKSLVGKGFLDRAEELRD